MKEATVHVHNGIDYSVNSEGRCDWHACTHNVYNSFDDPEKVKVLMVITLNKDDMGCEHGIDSRVTCGTCGSNWCEVCSPTPSARCPYEYDHDEVTPDPGVQVSELIGTREHRILIAIKVLTDAGFTVTKDGELYE